ncbi:hypothetical protein F4861DRAFT_512752 [Xylaria intraflava]|nr:hypothetical protein F4861DRAFT_512752 [Xylaria intraflava]
MESLRSQLAETQGALTERDKKFRQLRADHIENTKAWSQEKQALEARIADLEAKTLAPQNQMPSGVIGAVNQPTSPANLAMKSTENGVARKSLPTLISKKNANEDELLPITRAQMMKAEADFASLANKLDEKTKLCATLEARLALSSSAPVLELSQDEVVDRWNQLRSRISKFSQEYLDNTFDPKSISEACQRDLTALSPHWKSYTNTTGLPNFIFCAFIWRYLLRFFDIFCRAYGRDVSRKIGEVGALLWKKVPDAEFNAWRIRTAALVDSTYPVDKSLVDEVTQKILEQIEPVVEDKDASEYKTKLHNIVKEAADLSAVFDRSNFVVLMHDEPGSAHMHSFAYAANLMDMAKRLGTKGVVDLMITPSLLKKEADYSVLVKADVACG